MARRCHNIRADDHSRLSSVPRAVTLHHHRGFIALFRNDSSFLSRGLESIPPRPKKPICEGTSANFVAQCEHCSPSRLSSCRCTSFHRISCILQSAVVNVIHREDRHHICKARRRTCHIRGSRRSAHAVRHHRDSYVPERVRELRVTILSRRYDIHPQQSAHRLASS